MLLTLRKLPVIGLSFVHIITSNMRDIHTVKKLCIPSSEVHTRNLRSVSSNNMAVIRPNTNIMKKSFAYSSAILCRVKNKS
jgi:hypothetical protein